MEILSVHGLQQLSKPTSIHCGVWLLTFLLASSGLFYQLYGGILTVLAEPIETGIKVTNTIITDILKWKLAMLQISYEPVNFPVITVCNLNPFRRDALLALYQNITNVNLYDYWYCTGNHLLYKQASKITFRPLKSIPIQVSEWKEV